MPSRRLSPKAAGSTPDAPDGESSARTRCRTTIVFPLEESTAMTYLQSRSAWLGDPDSQTFADRWALWEARGRARDVRTLARVRLVAGLVVAALGIAFTAFALAPSG